MLPRRQAGTLRALSPAALAARAASASNFSPSSEHRAVTVALLASSLTAALSDRPSSLGSRATTCAPPPHSPPRCSDHLQLEPRQGHKSFDTAIERSEHRQHAHESLQITQKRLTKLSFPRIDTSAPEML